MTMRIINKTTNINRTQRNMIRLDRSPVINKIITIQSRASNKIYNQDIYCRRTWFSRAHNTILNYYINHIDINLTTFSSRDKALIFEELIRRRDFIKINKILSYVRSWEEKIFVDLLAKARAKFKRAVLNEPMIHVTNRIKYSFSLQSIVDIINKIGLSMFMDKYGKFGDFMNLIKNATVRKIVNQHLTQHKLNKKICTGSKIDNKNKADKNDNEDDGNDDGDDEENEQDTDMENVNNKSHFHLIPSTTLHPDIVPHYVKNYFYLKANKRRDKYDPYERLGSQVAQQIHKKVLKSYASFFSKRKSTRHDVRKSANPPSYRKNGQFVLVFQKTSFSVKTVNNKNFVYLSLGKTMKEKLLSFDHSSTGFLIFKLPKNIVADNITLNEIEIVPCKDKSVAFINYKYTTKVPIKPPRVDNANYRMISIDFGMTNLMTVFSLHLDNPIIYKGGYVMYVNKMYKNLIEGIYQPKLSNTYNKIKQRNLQNHMDKCWRKREAKIKDHFNKITNDLIKKCVDSKINEIILGYNKNWKNRVNMGHNNDKFYKVPYRSLVQMIFSKAEEKGITVIERNESYTSICDAVNWDRWNIMKTTQENARQEVYFYQKNAYS